MGCNTSKEAVQPVDDSNTGATNENQQSGEKKEQLANSTGLNIPEIDIDLNDPETEKAATKIQAVFRGHRTRQTMKSGDVTETVQDLEAEFNPNDQELCHAATKIQASFRGHMARKQVPATKGQPEDDLSKELQKLDAKVDDELADIDLTDPDLHKAATKIQASFRGHKVRKEGVTKEGEEEGEEEAAAGQ